MFRSVHKEFQLNGYSHSQFGRRLDEFCKMYLAVLQPISTSIASFELDVG